MSEIGRDVPGSPDSEGRFTWPTDTCPYPERWSSTDGDSTEVEVSVLAYGLVRALQPDICVETGTGFGQTAKYIVDALRVNGRGRLVTFETDPVRVGELREEGHRQEMTLVEGRLLDYDFADLTVGFAWLDSWYECRVPEFLYLRRWLRAGSIVCFHDTALGHGSHRIASGRDLRDEIDAELGRYLRIVHLPTPRGVTIAEVLP